MRNLTMKKNNTFKKIVIATVALGTAIYAANEFIMKYAVSKNLLKKDDGHNYSFKYGNILYKVSGEGKPVLLIHDINELISFLASMENYFHGSSSGIDPLQCYLGKPFILNGQQTTNNKHQILNQDFISENIHIFLIDTKIISPTSPLVNTFKENRKDKLYLEKFNNIYVPLVNSCISSLINKDDNTFFNLLLQLSTMQTEMLGHTIPENVKEFFFFDINKNHFQVKLCGAGGGGYLLGFTKDIEQTKRFWQNTEYQIHWVK